jgi:hypothetical protein
LNEDIIRLISHKKNELEWRLKGQMFRRFGTEVIIPVRSGQLGLRARNGKFSLNGIQVARSTWDIDLSVPAHTDAVYLDRLRIFQEAKLDRLRAR